MNNFEKIKAMGVDEMAEFIEQGFYCCEGRDCENNCMWYSFCNFKTGNDYTTEDVEGIKQWLELEVME